MKGETVTEITAAAQVMRELSNKVELRVKRKHLVDTCGTGGSGIPLFNISTASAFVVACAGGFVAKHGNRSVTSKSGSADLLEAAGVNLDLAPEQVAKCVNEIGVGFMFAVKHHSAMKHAIGPRREIGVRTIFNVLGPLTNPAAAPNQVLGVFDKNLVRPLAEVLKNLGSEHVLVVHSEDGLDEISLAGPTFVAELKDGDIREYTITPESLGLKTHPLDSLRIDDATQPGAGKNSIDRQPFCRCRHRRTQRGRRHLRRQPVQHIAARCRYGARHTGHRHRLGKTAGICCLHTACVRRNGKQHEHTD